jgi:hypothetical protein
MLQSVEQVDPVSSIVSDLKILESHYKELNIEEQIKNNRGDLVLTDKNLIEITNTAEKLRKGITQ